MVETLETGIVGMTSVERDFFCNQLSAVSSPFLNAHALNMLCHVFLFVLDKKKIYFQLQTNIQHMTISITISMDLLDLEINN